MALRPEYSLGHSAYNDFLFATVGAEKNGAQLTVLSALTRLGVDPWQEAARLSDLPRDAAAQALAATIARLPEGDWKESDLDFIAARLVVWLPGRSVPPVPPTPESRARAVETTETTQGKKPAFAGWLLWGAPVVALIVLILYL